jgi:hypothetical protein
MTSRISTLSILAALSLAACSHSPSAPNSPATVSGGGEASVARAPRSAPAAGRAFDAEGAPPSAAAPTEEVAKAEAERPGLGTSWGESRTSHVSSTSFYRQSEGSPDGLTAFYYNDEAGIAAMNRGRYVDYSESVASLAGGRITVSLVDPGGSPLRAARIDGRVVALGSDGDRYVVRIDNHSPVRIEAVATVDGLDVVDGSDGDLNKRGYVIAPYDTLDIEGFRESEGSVRAFRFGTVSDSYAARRGKDRNVGVVGVAVFRERGSDFRWTPEEMERRQSADPFPSHFAPPPPSGYRGW